MFSFRTRIFCSVLAVSLLSIGIAVFYGKRSLEQQQFEDIRRYIQYETRLAGIILDRLGEDAAGLASLSRLLDQPDARLSLLDKDGTVLADTADQAQPVAKLDNHADRPEVQQALREGHGYTVRPSGTLGLDMAYAVTRLEDGKLLRLAVPLADLRRKMESTLNIFGRIGLITVVLSLGLAALISGALRRSLNRMVVVVESVSLGKFRRRLRRIPGREFAPLADAVNRMAENIEDLVRTGVERNAQLESILDTISDGVLVLGPRGRIRRCNRALAAQFPNAALAGGVQVVEVIPSPALQQAVEELLAAAPPEVPTVELDESGEAVPVDGLGAPAELIATAASSAVASAVFGPERAGNGLMQRRLHLELSDDRVMDVCLSRPSAQDNALGLVIVFHDITELMRLERVRRDFVANVSHELRTPLTAIQGYAETLISLDASPECRRFGEIILKNGVYLTRMVEDLLSLARLEGRENTLELVPVDPAEALRQATAVCREVFERRSLRLETQISPACRVMADAPQLVRVFRNLLENACRYAPENSAVQITAAMVQSDIEFRVIDHGPGIPPADLERIFERFYQVERHRGQSSTGLGLAICKHIVERSGGRIRAESPLAGGNGTALIFTLVAAHGAAHV